ncbi:MAG: hypothetical protein EAZ53_14875 [Bacteroidetes bacterium]|nr:MAG: hypothetical protein EAZ53_14875 [Bacteroidota bacterium]
MLPFINFRSKFYIFFKKSTFLLLVLGMINGLLAFKNKPQGGTLAIIVNKENKISEMTEGQIKLIWLKRIKKRWAEINKAIRPADRKKKCTEKEAFYDKILSMQPDEVELYFAKIQFENAEKPQEKLNSDQEMIQYISEEIGGIGYVNLNSISDKDKENIKIVFTIAM